LVNSCGQVAVPYCTNATSSASILSAAAAAAGRMPAVGLP
jgi:hypothetical protein